MTDLPRDVLQLFDLSEMFGSDHVDRIAQGTMPVHVWKSVLEGTSGDGDTSIRLYECVEDDVRTWCDV